MEDTRVDEALVKDPLLVETYLWLQTTENANILSSIWYSFYSHDCLHYFHTFLIQKELSKTQSTEQIMREDSPEIALLQYNLRTFGIQWIVPKLTGPVRKIICSKSSFEIDPNRLENKEQHQKNLTKLLRFVSSIFDSFFGNIDDIPQQIVETCQIIHQQTKEKFPDSKYRALASYLFLRFICPAISSPDSYDIVKRGTVTRETRRKLVLVTKIIQSVVNNAPNSNESYMNVVNDFVAQKVEQLDLFFDTILAKKYDGTFVKKGFKCPVLVDSLVFHQQNLVSCLANAYYKLEDDFFDTYSGPFQDYLVGTRELCKQVYEQETVLCSPTTRFASFVPVKRGVSKKDARLFRRRKFSLPFRTFQPKNRKFQDCDAFL
mmetsp:Transcript_15791/g.24688  ORF Transcript_15791/g.24688 Transcript_15791/m.24688 type:complete len:376 (+) Transcript_15791:2-1129(+)